MRINIDESLNWEKQCITGKKKLKRGISSLRKLKDILPQRQLEQVYKALSESHLRYGSIVWNALSNIKLSKLQRLQIRARKLIENAKFTNGWNCIWLDVESLISFDQGVMTDKTLHGLYPDNLSHEFVERSMVSVEREIVEICKFPKLGQNIRREVFTSRVSKTGMIFLAASENKSHSFVSKRDLEGSFRTCKAQTRPLGRAAILFD